MSLLPHLQCRPDQIAERVVLCGDPARVERIAGQLDQCEPLGQHREFRLINGRYRGLPVTVCSTGIGGASAVIALEELVQAIRATQDPGGRSREGLLAPVFAEAIAATPLA